MNVYLLIECDVESCHTHAVYSTKRSCLKSMLELKRKTVQDKLDFRLIVGKNFINRDWYKDTWEGVNLYAQEFEVLE